MEDEWLRDAEDNADDSSSGDVSQRVSASRIRTPALGLLLFAPKLVTLAETVDELAHRPNENKMSDGGPAAAGKL